MKANKVEYDKLNEKLMSMMDDQRVINEQFGNIKRHHKTNKLKMSHKEMSKMCDDLIEICEGLIKNEADNLLYIKLMMVQIFNDSVGVS